MDLLNVSIKNDIACLTLNNPPLNVMSVPLTKALDEALVGLAADDAARVLVVTATGERAFCAGSDIHEFASFTGTQGRVLERKMNAESATFSKLARFPKPTVAALNGSAIGGGLELAVCCDLVVAADHAKLSLPEVKLGVFPGSGGPMRVARRIGEARTKEMMLLGDPIDAATALEWGLINRVCSRGEAMESALELAQRLALLPSNALRVSKQAISLGFDLPDEEARQRSLALTEEVFEHSEVEEGLRAFFAKEKPDFRSK